MKKTFLARRNALLSRANLSWGVVALIFSLFALLIRLLVPNLFWQALSPVFHATDGLAAANHAVFSGFTDVVALTHQNVQLERDNSALAAENKTLTQKLSDLSLLVGTDDGTADASGIVAGVVARPPVSAYDILVVAEGSEAGVLEGMEAFGPGGVPLGVVGGVATNFSQIVLFSSPLVSTAGWVGPDAIPLTIVGAGGGVFKASVSRAARVVVGDIVYVPGPGQLPVGVVTRIDSDPSAPSDTVHIKPALNLYSVAWVQLRATGVSSFSTLLTASSTAP